MGQPLEQVKGLPTRATIGLTKVKESTGHRQGNIPDRNVLKRINELSKACMDSVELSPGV